MQGVLFSPRAILSFLLPCIREYPETILGQAVGASALEAYLNEIIGIIDGGIRIRHHPVDTDKVIHIRLPCLICRCLKHFHTIAVLKYHNRLLYVGLTPWFLAVSLRLHSLHKRRCPVFCGGRSAVLSETKAIYWADGILAPQDSQV